MGVKMEAKNQIKIEEELLHYKGEDEVISSHELLKQLKEEQRPELR